MTGVQAKFVDLGRSDVPAGDRAAAGTYPHPYVVQLSVTGPHVAISVGSGHLGSGRVLRLEDVLLSTGELDPRWREEVEGAHATWALPLLHALAGGAALTEADVVAAYRAQHGSEPRIEELPVG